MPNTYVVNQKPITYGGAMSLLAEMLVGAGWTYQASGDGLAAFNGSGKVFTTTGSGATGWNNNRAWARMQDPGGAREFVFQLSPNSGSTDGSVRIKYSANSKFTGGSPSATVTPSAADERYLRGGTSDATPTYNLWFSTGTVTASYGTGVLGAGNLNGSVIYQGAALAAAPYGFWFSAQTQDGSKLKASSLLFDPVVSAPEDTDPYVIQIAHTNSFLYNANNMGRDGNTAGTWTVANGGVTEGCWAHMDVARTQFLNVQPAGYSPTIAAQTLSNVAGATVSTGGATNAFMGNPFNGNRAALPVAYMRTATTATAPGLKGWSTMMRWTTEPRTAFIDTLDDRSWICVGAVWLPWDGVSQPMG